MSRDCGSHIPNEIQMSMFPQATTRDCKQYFKLEFMFMKHCAPTDVNKELKVLLKCQKVGGGGRELVNCENASGGEGVGWVNVNQKLKLL